MPSNAIKAKRLVAGMEMELTLYRSSSQKSENMARLEAAGGFDHNICYPLLSAPVLAPLVSVCLGGRSATGGWTRSGGEQLSGRSWQLAAAGAAQLSAVIPPYQYNTRAAAAPGRHCQILACT